MLASQKLTGCDTIDVCELEALHHNLVSRTFFDTSI
jgi:hypothetical protein